MNWWQQKSNILSAEIRVICVICVLLRQLLRWRGSVSRVCALFRLTQARVTNPRQREIWLFKPVCSKVQIYNIFTIHPLTPASGGHPVVKLNLLILYFPLLLPSFSTFNCQLSIINCQLSILNYQLSIVFAKVIQSFYILFVLMLCIRGEF